VLAHPITAIVLPVRLSKEMQPAIIEAIVSVCRTGLISFVVVIMTGEILQVVWFAIQRQKAPPSASVGTVSVSRKTQQELAQVKTSVLPVRRMKAKPFVPTGAVGDATAIISAYVRQRVIQRIVVPQIVLPVRLHKVRLFVPNMVRVFVLPPVILHHAMRMSVLPVRTEQRLCVRVVGVSAFVSRKVQPEIAASLRVIYALHPKERRGVRQMAIVFVFRTG